MKQFKPQPVFYNHLQQKLNSKNVLIFQDFETLKDLRVIPKFQFTTNCKIICPADLFFFLKNWPENVFVSRYFS